MMIRHLSCLVFLELVCIHSAMASPELNQSRVNEQGEERKRLQIVNRYEYSGVLSSLYIRQDGSIEVRILSSPYDNRGSKLHLLSSNLEKVGEVNIDPLTELVGSIEDKSFLGTQNPNFYQLEMGEYSWEFPNAHNDRHIYEVGGSAYFASIHIANNRRSVFLREVTQGGVPVNGEAQYIAEDLLPNRLVLSGGELYFEAKQEFFSLRLDAGEFKWSQLLSGRYGRIAIGEMDGFSFLATAPAKIFVQNELRIYRLPQKQLLHSSKRSYSIVGLHFCTTRDYALLGISSKDSVNKGELMLFDTQGKLLLRDKSIRVNRYMKYSPVSDSFVLAVSGNQKLTGEIIEIKVVDKQDVD